MSFDVSRPTPEMSLTVMLSETSKSGVEESYDHPHPSLSSFLLTSPRSPEIEIQSNPWPVITNRQPLGSYLSFRGPSMSITRHLVTKLKRQEMRSTSLVRGLVLI